MQAHLTDNEIVISGLLSVLCWFEVIKTQLCFRAGK